MSSNHTKTHLKARDGAHNRTQIPTNGGNSQNNRKQATKRSLLLRFTIFISWVAAIGLLLSLVACTSPYSKPIATNTNNGYYKDLSKTNSDLPSRKLLAFFMPDNSAASQAVTIQLSIAPQAQLSATRGQTIISKVNTSPTSYDGTTLQNKRAERRICRAVTICTESEPRHPIRLSYSVASTQKQIGVIHHG